MRIVQLSDPHLFATPSWSGGRRLRDVPTDETLQQVLRTLAETMLDCDLCIVTGDLAQDEEEATYRRLRGMLGPFEGRLRVVPGNHDDPQAMKAVFGDLLADQSPGCCFCDTVGPLKVVGLDSHVAGRVDGELGQAQLSWFESVLHHDGPVLVFVHHPPAPVGTAWLDELGLRDGTALLDAIERYDSYAAVAHGHTHRATRQVVRGIDIFGAPSTAFQFAADGPRGAISSEPPGFRVFDFASGAVRSEVIWMPTRRG